MNTPRTPLPLAGSLPILSCGNCGLCCHTQTAPPFMPTELDALPAHVLAQLPDESGPPRPAGSACVWLTPEKTCRHYEHRPEVCRQFEMGAEECREIRAAAGR